MRPALLLTLALLAGCGVVDYQRAAFRRAEIRRTPDLIFSERDCEEEGHEYRCKWCGECAP